MTPKSFVALRVVGWESRRTREGVYFLENCIDLIIGEDTVGTVDDAIELSLGMESEAEIVVDPLFLRNIFPPRKLYLVSVSVDLG